MAEARNVSLFKASTEAVGLTHHLFHG